MSQSFARFICKYITAPLKSGAATPSQRYVSSMATGLFLQRKNLLQFDSELFSVKCLLKHQNAELF